MSPSSFKPTPMIPPPMTAAKRQGMVLGLLNNKLTRGAIYSPGAIADLLHFGGRYGFDRVIGGKIMNLIRTHSQRLNIEEPMYNTMEAVLLHDSDRAYHALRGEAQKVDGQIIYDELNYIDHHITCDFAEIMDIMRNEMRVASSWPLYLDTEGSYSELLNGSKLALITLFDVDSRTVYLFRVHRMSYDQLQTIQRELKIVANNRRIVSFGPETTIKCPTSNIQRHPRLSLQAAADQIRVPISKSETMSNWCGAQLRDDQIQYAAMDAIVLHNINIGTTLDWSYSPPRPSRPDISPRFFDPVAPTPTQMHKIAEIRFEMMEVVDWIWDVTIIDILEATNTQLGLATGERSWEIEVSKQVHILEDVKEELGDQRKSREKIGWTIEALRGVLEHS
ncbi:hypothetical protein CRE_12172 [Caenorhabditis remanei]|uniref:3'-5' exonuclease domain-containing protein n=1 Tax=Caenorhabditis remanei TaxID=31234 RepID=E3N0C1_CAERE|nr:hypothetical protein CRE_12172 [Caenorhabditis remanei]